MSFPLHAVVHAPTIAEVRSGLSRLPGEVVLDLKKNQRVELVTGLSRAEGEVSQDPLENQ